MTPLSPIDPLPRRRTTRACDQCRKTKSRCEHPPQSQEPCRNCVLSGTDCTFLEPSHKRGPPKGYLSALEQRLHDAEALLGAIISSTDARAITMIQDLSKDSLAANIIARVTNSTFGPVGRNSARHRDPTASRRRTMDLRHQMTENEAPMIDRNGHLVFSAPSHTWQDYLNLRLSLENRFRSQTATPGSYSQDTRQSPSDHLAYAHSALASKLPTLTAAYHFPVSDSTQMTADTTVIESPPPDERIILCRNTSENGESDASSTANRSDGTLVELGAAHHHSSPPTVHGSVIDVDHDYVHKSYPPRDYLARSLGLDTGMSSMLEPPFPQMTGSESPLDFGSKHRSSTLKPSAWSAPSSKSEESDAATQAAWTGLVVDSSMATENGHEHEGHHVTVAGHNVGGSSVQVAFEASAASAHGISVEM